MRRGGTIALKRGDLPVSMGSLVLTPPALAKISVSTIPGCTVAAKMWGCWSGRNSITFTCANFEVIYADKFAKFLTGAAVMPEVKANTVA